MDERYKFLGRRVKGKFSKLTGIIIAVIGEEIHDGYIYKVRYWDEKKVDYTEKHIHGAFLFMMHNEPEIIPLADAEFYKFYQEAAIEAALIVGDKELFDDAKRMDWYLKHL